MLRDPSQSEAGTFKKILVAVDGSEPARRAVCTAVRLAKCLNAGCSIVHVVDTSPVTSPEMISTFAIERATLLDNGKVIVTAACERAGVDFAVDAFLREGNPAHQIVALADEIDADLIVIGTHARGRLARMLLGSTAEAVVRTAICPVLTVGHGPERARSEAHKAQYFTGREEPLAAPSTAPDQLQPAGEQTLLCAGAEIV